MLRVLVLVVVASFEDAFLANAHSPSCLFYPVMNTIMTTVPVLYSLCS